MKPTAKATASTLLPKDVICPDDSCKMKLSKFRQRYRAMLEELHSTAEANGKLRQQLEQAGLKPTF